MKQKGFVDAFERPLTWILEKPMWFAALILFILMLITIIDVVGRYLFSHPLAGSNEITQVGMILVIFLAGGYYTIKGHQIIIDSLTAHLSKRKLVIVNCITGIFSILIMGIITWRMTVWGLANLTSRTGAVTNMLQIPEAPFMLAAALGCFLVFIAVLAGLLRSITQIKG